jgi:hypothetical protein
VLEGFVKARGKTDKMSNVIVHGPHGAGKTAIIEVCRGTGTAGGAAVWPSRSFCCPDNRPIVGDFLAEDAARGVVVS